MNFEFWVPAAMIAYAIFAAFKMGTVWEEVKREQAMWERFWKEQDKKRRAL